MDTPWEMKAAGEDAGAGSVAVPETRSKAPVEKIRIEQHGFAGMLWIGAWLFTLGFLHLPFWKGVLALVLWPYYLGTTFAPHP